MRKEKDNIQPTVIRLVSGCMSRQEATIEALQGGWSKRYEMPAVLDVWSRESVTRSRRPALSHLQCSVKLSGRHEECLMKKSTTFHNTRRGAVYENDDQEEKYSNRVPLFGHQLGGRDGRRSILLPNPSSCPSFYTANLTPNSSSLSLLQPLFISSLTTTGPHTC